MPVTYEVRFDVIPSQVDRFLELLVDVMDATRRERAFRRAILQSDPECGHRFSFSETWEKHEDILAVLERPYRKRWRKALPSLLAAERDITVSSGQVDRDPLSRAASQHADTRA